MDTTQHVFYIIGSVALGLVAIFILFAIGFLVFIQRKLNNASRGLAMLLRGSIATRGLRAILGLIKRK